jgi:hypothetical protein|tara:strand:- start:2452 stop:2610 length:159 start_codon:yes stop_codon:yes gene_type:complete
MGVSKQMQIEEMDRISREEYDEDGNPKEQEFVNEELIEVIEGLQKKYNKEEK